uniref:Heat shock protein 101 n=1 Tax=Aegilops tauschii TaxID=37682 RepID=M8CGR0_AEGTA
MRKVISHAEASKGKIILFIDEMHTLPRAGDSDGVADAASMLKPALARGRIRCVGATTFDEYRKHIEKDTALERRFQKVVSRWTGIPITELDRDEKVKLVHLADRLHERVVGQNEAVDLVAEAVLCSRVGLARGGEPVGSFLFLGSTGVGKTELAKALAEQLFGSEKMLLLDDGVLTDGQGWNVDFKNTIIIMTSNLGANHLTAGNTLKVAHDLLMKQVRKYFKPELLNRLSEIVIFEPLSHHQLKEIVNIQMKEIIVRVDVILKDAALDVILSESYNPMYGARPIKRWVEKNIITIICKMLVNGEADEGSMITIDAAMDKKGLKFQVAKNLRPENPEPMVSSRREKVKDIHVGTKTW